MIQENLKAIHNAIPDDVKLVCVSKFHPIESIKEAYDAGERNFGESRVQELVEKYNSPLLPKDILWHFIGPLQTNKIKYLIPCVHLIHSIENERQLGEIQRCAAKISRRINVLLEVHIASEEQKHGFDKREVMDFFTKGQYHRYPNINVVGLMGIATLTNDKQQIIKEFSELKQLFTEVRSLLNSPIFC